MTACHGFQVTYLSDTRFYFDHWLSILHGNIKKTVRLQGQGLATSTEISHSVVSLQKPRGEEKLDAT